MSNLTPLIYTLHSGNLYGTERMALATAVALRGDFDPVIMAPPGPVHDEAHRINVRSITFCSVWEFGARLRPFLMDSTRIAFLATGVSHSLVCLSMNKLYRRKLAHLHLVHGGANERLSYGRKKYLNGCGPTFVAVSSFVRERLIANGVARKQIAVVENFLSARANAPVRAPFMATGIRCLAVVSRLDPGKRVELLIEALEQNADLRDVAVHIYGTGWDSSKLETRAAAANLNIHFEGYRTDIRERLAACDLLAHTCPTEPFGLAILEAMAARVPVLVPDSGGAGLLVQHGIDGFRFHANNPRSLAEEIRTVRGLSPARLNRVVQNACDLVETRFSERERIGDYRRLLLERLA